MRKYTTRTKDNSSIVFVNKGYGVTESIVSTISLLLLMVILPFYNEIFTGHGEMHPLKGIGYGLIFGLVFLSCYGLAIIGGLIGLFTTTIKRQINILSLYSIFISCGVIWYLSYKL